MQAPQPPSETQRFENKVKSYSQVAERFESQRVLNINHDINPMPIENVNVKTSYEMKKADEVSPHAVTKGNNTVSQTTDTPITKQPFVRPRNDATVRLNISRPDKVETHMMLADNGAKISRKKNEPQMETAMKAKSAILMQNMILSKKNAVIAKNAALYNAINNAVNTKPGGDGLDAPIAPSGDAPIAASGDAPIAPSGDAPVAPSGDAALAASGEANNTQNIMGTPTNITASPSITTTDK